MYHTCKLQWQQNCYYNTFSLKNYIFGKSVHPKKMLKYRTFDKSFLNVLFAHAFTCTDESF